MLYPDLKRLYTDGRIHRLAGITVLVFLGTSLCQNLENFVDLDFGDELGYLSIGKHLNFFASRIFYPLWYKFLFFFESDPVRLFYLNQKVLIIALPVCLFLLLYETLKHFTFCLLAACLFLYANNNVAAEFNYYGQLLAVVFNKINHFTLCLICLLGVAIIRLHKTGLSLVSLLACSFLILSYCRNEYGLPYLVMIVIYPVVFFIRLRHIRREWYLFLPFILAVPVTYYLFGFSALAGGHSNIHYIMSYSRNYLERHHEILNADVDFISPCLHVFGHQHSLLDFFRSDPAAFTENILYNIYNMARQLFLQLPDILIPQVFLPYKDHSSFNYIISGIFLILLFAGMYFLVKDKRFRSEPVRTFLIFFTLLAATNIIPNVLYYYDPRYFVFFTPVIYLFIAHALSRFFQHRIFHAVAGLGIIAMLLFHPGIKTYMQRNRYPVLLPNQEYTGHLKTYLQERQLRAARLLTNTGNLDLLLPGVKTDDFNRINQFLDPDPDSKFRDIREYDMILVKKVNGPQDYLWFTRIQEQLVKYGNAYTHRYANFGNFSYHLYLKK